MKSMTAITTELLVKSEERLANTIIRHQKTLAEAFETICKDLLGMETNSFTLVQKFQGIGTLDRTLDIMLAFYRASYGRDFNEADWIKEEVVQPNLSEVLNKLADKLDCKDLPK